MMIVACVKRSSNSSLETNLSNRVARPNAKCALNNPRESNHPGFRVNGLDNQRQSNVSRRLSDLKLHVTRQVRREFDNHSRNHRRGLIGLQNTRDRSWRLNRNQLGLIELQNRRELRDNRRCLNRNQNWLGEAIHQCNSKAGDRDKNENSKVRPVNHHSRRVTARGKANLRSLKIRVNGMPLGLVFNPE
jgi:hypothetical protein